MKKKIIWIAALVGFILFAFIIFKIGPERIWAHISKITWQGFLVLFFMRFLYWLLRTMGWQTVLQGYQTDCSLLHLFAVRLSCHSISHLTPSAQIGGEATRIMLVDTPDRKISLASVIVDKTIEFLSMTGFTVFAVIVFLSKIPMPSTYKILYIVLASLSPLLLLYVVKKQKQGFLGSILKGLGKLKIKFRVFDKYKEKIEQIDENISGFYREHPRVFLKAFTLYVVLALFWTTEIHVTLLFIGVQGVTFIDSLIIVSIGSLALLFPLVPAAIGVYEATNIGVFVLLGFGAEVGVTLVLIRRILALAWAGIGLVGMTRLTPDKQKK